MTKTLSLPLILISLITITSSGCAAKPKPPSPADQAAIRERLNDFSGAWGAADPAAIRENFHLHTPETQRFVDAAAKLRVAQANLAKEQKALAVASGGELPEAYRNVTLPDVPPYFREYARGAREPEKMLEEKEVVTVDLPGDHQPKMRLSKDDSGAWKINAASLAANEPISAATNRMNRQTAFLEQATAATKSRDAAGLKQIVQRFNQQEMVDRMSQAARQELDAP